MKMTIDFEDRSIDSMDIDSYDTMTGNRVLLLLCIRRLAVIKKV